MTTRCRFSHSGHCVIPAARSECVKRSEFSVQYCMLNSCYADFVRVWRGRVKFSQARASIRAAFQMRTKFQKSLPAKNFDNCLQNDGLKRNFVTGVCA